MNIYLSIAAGGMQMAGQVMKSQDNNESGSDDMVGSLLITGSTAILAYGQGNDTGFRKALRVIADSIYLFLGLVPTQAPNPNPTPLPTSRAKK